MTDISPTSLSIEGLATMPNPAATTVGSPTTGPGTIGSDLSPMQQLYIRQCTEVARGGSSGTRPKPSRTVLHDYIPRWESYALKQPPQALDLSSATATTDGANEGSGSNGTSTCNLVPFDVDMGQLVSGDEGAAAIFDTLRLFGQPTMHRTLLTLSASTATTPSTSVLQAAPFDESRSESGMSVGSILAQRPPLGAQRRPQQRRTLYIKNIKCPANNLRMECAFPSLMRLLRSPNGQYVQHIDVTDNLFLALQAAQALLQWIVDGKEDSEEQQQQLVISGNTTTPGATPTTRGEAVGAGMNEDSPPPRNITTSAAAKKKSTAPRRRSVGGISIVSGGGDGGDGALGLKSIELEGTNIPPHYKRRIHAAVAVLNVSP